MTARTRTSCTNRNRSSFSCQPPSTLAVGGSLLLLLLLLLSLGRCSSDRHVTTSGPCATTDGSRTSARLTHARGQRVGDQHQSTHLHAHLLAPSLARRRPSVGALQIGGLEIAAVAPWQDDEQESAEEPRHEYGSHPGWVSSTPNACPPHHAETPSWKHPAGRLALSPRTTAGPTHVTSPRPAWWCAATRAAARAA